MFKGSVTIAKIFRVPIRIHWTFLLLLAWIFGLVLYEGGSALQALVALGFITAVFACVVAHEFGHILIARSFGIKTRDVTLLPIGGVASLERMPEKPWQELAVALAGPMVNVIIAAVIFPVVLQQQHLREIVEQKSPLILGEHFLASIAMINIWLVLFNMIPAFPMDGGRVLRSVLMMFTDRLTATRVAASVGQVLAVLMALFGLFFGLLLLIVLAMFVFLAAGAEAAGTQAYEMLRNLPVSAVMVHEFRVLGTTQPLQHAVDALLSNSQADFPVTDSGMREGRLVGLLTRSDLVSALARQGPGAEVQSAMRPIAEPVQPHDKAQIAFARLQGSGNSVIPVVEDEKLIGLLTHENVAEAIMIRGALHHDLQA